MGCVQRFTDAWAGSLLYGRSGEAAAAAAAAGDVHPQYLHAFCICTDASAVCRRMDGIQPFHASTWQSRRHQRALLLVQMNIRFITLQGKRRYTAQLRTRLSHLSVFVLQPQFEVVV